MKRLLVIFLSIIFLSGLFFETVVLAIEETSPTHFIKNVSKSVSSITSTSKILSVVKGTVTLTVPQLKLLAHTSLRSIQAIRSIQLGSDRRVRAKKTINVKGSNNGSIIQLRGTGKDKDYSFSLSGKLDKLNKPLKGGKASNFSVSGNSVLVKYGSLDVSANSSDIEVVRSKDSALLSSTFSVKAPIKGKKPKVLAKGRFHLTLSEEE